MNKKIRIYLKDYHTKMQYNEIGYLSDFTQRQIREEKCPLMFFTGLKDKNKIHIYEGDIIGDYIVKWSKSNNGFVGYSKNISVNLNFLIDKGELVKGNIYQNKELIK